MSPAKDVVPRRRSPPVPESGRNYDCDSPCTSPPSLHRSMPRAEKAVKREKVTNVIGIAQGFPAFPLPRALPYTGCMPLPTAHEVFPGDATHVALLRRA